MKDETNEMTRIAIQTGLYEVNTSILVAGEQAVIVDPGGEAERIAALLAERRLTPAAIWLTHAHFDHIGAIPGLLARFPGLPVRLGAADVPVLTHPMNALQPDYPPIPRPAVLQAWAATDRPWGVEVIDTPGHTPGGVSYYFAREKLLLSGDTLFAGSAGRTDFPGGDMAALTESLAKLMRLPEETLVVPGHGSTTTIGAERRSNPFCRILSALAVALVAVLPLFGGIRVETDGAKDRTVQIAADEFRKFYTQLTGKPAAGETRVLLRVDPALSADGYDAFSMVSDARGAVLTGGNPRSVLYAVYELLEKRGGCRWYWDGDLVPKIAELDLANLNETSKSRFKYRATRYFSHRGLTRFRALQWGPDEWRREIDYLAKIKVNVFMLRLGWFDLFQKAFPDVCAYPDPAVRLPGTGTGYDNHSLHWSLQFRGLLRKAIQDYGFERGLLQPEDFGTMTHWYTRTPKDFIDKVKPDFLPNSVDWYSDPAALVWDIRDPKWMDAYWRLTEASIRHYGRSDILHTMGLSERTCSTNAAENLRLKIEVTKRLIDDAQRRHPESLIILGGWDFHFTWEVEECRELFAALRGYRNLLLWDYSVDERREGGVVNSRLDNAMPSNWDVIGKFPYTFGVFCHATSCTDIRGDYPRIEREWAKCKDDPFCQGYIWWAETEHCDALWYEYFSKNVWRPQYRVEDLYAGFCRDRYGAEAAAMERVWRRVVPISIGHGCGHLSMNILPFAPKVIDREKCFRTVPWRRCLNDAPAIFRDLAAVSWTDEKVKRDTIDLARTVADRVLYALLSKVRVSLRAWRAGTGTAAEVKRFLRATAALTDAFADLLALHTDYSLAESYARLDAVEKVRNPDFPQVLLENAINDYCLGFQYEAAEYWFKPVAHDLEKGIGALVDGDDRAAPLAVAKTDYRAWMLGTPLREMAPTLPRTPANYRRAMGALADALEALGPVAPDADETIHFDGKDEFFN